MRNACHKALVSSMFLFLLLTKHILGREGWHRVLLRNIGKKKT